MAQQSINFTRHPRHQNILNWAAQFLQSADFNTGLNWKIVILNKLIRNINNGIDEPDKSKLLNKLITLDTIDI